MNYEQLRLMWEAQEQKITEWKKALEDSAQQFKKELILRLFGENSPKITTENGVMHDYVILHYIEPDDTLVPFKTPAFDKCLTAAGEMLFNVSIFFATTKGRKFEAVSFPVMLRYRCNIPSFTFYYVDKNGPVSDIAWTNMQSFIEQCLEQLKKELSHNPFDAPKTKSTFGFIKGL